MLTIFAVEYDYWFIVLDDVFEEENSGWKVRVFYVLIKELKMLRK